jgi:hypothetical protein
MYCNKKFNESPVGSIIFLCNKIDFNDEIPETFNYDKNVTLLLKSEESLRFNTPL